MFVYLLLRSRQVAIAGLIRLQFTTADICDDIQGVSKRALQL